MNKPQHNLAFDDEHQLDLLVDGELTDEDRRDLLSRLDREPSGWRRCALAFLEAQSWHGAMRKPASAAASASTSMAATTAALPATPHVSPSKSPAARWWPPRYGGTLMSMAASFFLAFGLGWGINGYGPATAPVADAPSLAGTPTQVQPHSGTHNSPSAVTLVMDDGATGQLVPVEVPLVERQGVDPMWLQQPSSVPLDVQRVLERMGHQVRQQRQLLPVQLEDGRQGVVPIDEVQVVPVSNRHFQ